MYVPSKSSSSDGRYSGRSRSRSRSKSSRVDSDRTRDRFGRIICSLQSTNLVTPSKLLILFS
jgi:hypothetical protein